MSAHHPRTPRQQLFLALFILLLFAAVCTGGFYTLGPEDRSLMHAMYLTAQIFSTVGNIPDQFTHAEEAWAMLMIIFGIGGAVYAFGTVMALITTGQIQQALGRRQLASQIQSLSDHLIVCGFGRMGQNVCRQLRERNRPFVLIERDDQCIAEADEAGYLYIEGDATDEQTLREAGVERAVGLVSCLADDADNVFVTLTAHGLNDRMTIISRSETENAERQLLRAGASRVVCPVVIGASKVTRMLLHPAMDDLFDSAFSQDLAIDSIAVKELEGMVGRTLHDLDLPRHYGLIVLAIERRDGGRVFNPPPQHELEADEKLVIVGLADSVETLLARHGG